MTYNKRSKFSWSFTGYGSEEECTKALEDMVAWFNLTYVPAEWQVTTSKSQTPYGYRAAMSAERDATED